MESDSSDQIGIESFFKSRKCFADNDAMRREAAKILVSNGIRRETLSQYNFDESFLRTCGFSSNDWPTPKLQSILNCLNELRIRDLSLVSQSLEETDVTIGLKVCGGTTPYGVKLWKNGIDEDDKMLVEKRDKSSEQDFVFTLTKAQITDSGVYLFEIIDSKGNHIFSHDFQICVKLKLNGSRQMILKTFLI
jgi:hypothetical protein